VAGMGRRRSPGGYSLRSRREWPTETSAPNNACPSEVMTPGLENRRGRTREFRIGDQSKRSDVVRQVAPKRGARKRACLADWVMPSRVGTVKAHHRKEGT